MRAHIVEAGWVEEGFPRFSIHWGETLPQRVVIEICSKVPEGERGIKLCPSLAALPQLNHSHLGDDSCDVATGRRIETLYILNVSSNLAIEKLPNLLVEICGADLHGSR